MKSSLLKQCIIYLAASKALICAHFYYGAFVKATSGCIMAAPLVKHLLYCEAGCGGLCMNDIISYSSNSGKSLLLCAECHSKAIRSKLCSDALKLRTAFLLALFFPEATTQLPCGG